MPIVKMLKDDDAATSIEYALVGSLIAIAALLGMQSLGIEVNSNFVEAADKMAAANNR